MAWRGYNLWTDGWQGTWTFSVATRKTPSFIMALREFFPKCFALSLPKHMALHRAAAVPGLTIDFRSELPPATAQVVRCLLKERPHSICILLIGATTHGHLRFSCPFFVFHYRWHTFSSLIKKSLGVLDSTTKSYTYSYQDIKSIESNSNILADFLACRLD
jgi:hypothetical protein